jgi:hypothetical protein
MGLSAIFLDRDALFRSELARTGKPDPHGRVMLQDWELGLAVNHALRYLRPDEPLRQAILDGRMRTREDVRREVVRMLEDDSIRKPRVLQFFRDFFDYDLAGYVGKDEKALEASGALSFKDHYLKMFDATASTDRLVELVLEEDRDVLRELLTTQRVVAAPSDDIYFATRLDPEAEKKKRAQQKPKPKKRDPSLRQQADEAKIERALFEGEPIYARVGRPSYAGRSLKPDRILTTAPEGQRLGILTHPSWLVSHSDAMDNHAIHRGIWIRERLLGGGIPDVPITVDAQLPDEPESTLRERMRVTREEYCWKCHQKMDPLGLPFEMYNHAGLFRTDREGQTRRHQRRDHRFRRSESGRPGRGRPRHDRQARRERAGRAGLRPPRLPLLDGAQRNAERRAGAAGRPSGLPGQWRQHESPDHLAGDL